MLLIIDEKEACLLDRQTHRQVIVMTNLARQKGEKNSSCPLRGIVEHSPSLHTWEGSNVEQHR